MLTSGVSLEALLALGADAAAWDQKASTRQVVQHFIQPATEAKGCTYLSTLPHQAAGMPRYYVVHAWGGLFQDLVAAVRSKLAGRPAAECFVWLDIMAVPQAGAHNLDLSFFQVCHRVRGRVCVMDWQERRAARRKPPPLSPSLHDAWPDSHTTLCST